MPVGVIFALSAYALYSCCDAITKGLGSGLSIYEIAFFTTLFSLLPAIFTTPRGENWLTFWKIRHPLLLNLRGLTGMIGNLCIIYAFVTIPLAEAYSLAFLAPIFIVFISVQLLAEKVSPQRWLLLGASFVGVLIVVRPGFRELHWGHLAAVVAAVCGAVTTSVLRRIAKEEARTSLIGVASIYVLVVNGVLIVATGGFQQLTWQQLAWLLTIGGLGGTGNLLFIAATRNAPASMVAPVQYSQILWAIVFGAVFYAEYPATIAYLGLAAIIVAGIFNVLSEETRIRIFSRLSPNGAGPATLEESSTAADAVLEAPIAGAAEATSER
ncbi:MAG TPA: DMT family transporter [Devosia sp.]|jgi:drug/metabolite transporter (DMT)-like permease|nr:DMT family transporter [Devosia sp.]